MHLKRHRLQLLPLLQGLRLRLTMNPALTGS